MKEKDWDCVFQANKILHCSFVNAEENTVARALHAVTLFSTRCCPHLSDRLIAIRLRDFSKDDAGPDLPQDDEKGKIPVWPLSQEPSHTYLEEINSELETSASTKGHLRKSWEVCRSRSARDPSFCEKCLWERQKRCGKVSGSTLLLAQAQDLLSTEVAMSCGLGKAAVARSERIMLVSV